MCFDDLINFYVVFKKGKIEEIAQVVYHIIKLSKD